MFSQDFSDRDLMGALIDGDHRALEVIIERWERPLFSFAHRYTQNEHATREIVQETFVRVFTKREKYDSKYPLSSWIFTIAANLCKNKARWHKRHPEVSIEATTGASDSENARRMIDVLPSAAPEPSDLLVEDEELEALKQVVLSLPHDLRTVVLLHHYENVPYKEIAEIVGCSARGVETRLYRARKLLRVRMTQLLEREESPQKKKPRPCSDGLSELAPGVAS